MSATLSNLSVSVPFSSKRQHTSFKPSPFRFQSNGGSNVKAVSAQGRDNLDHLQRVVTNKPQQQQPKRKNQQVSPLGLWGRFPSARTVQQMMDTMERMIDDPFTLTREDVPGGYRRGRTPWEIKEGENEYKMRFDMPGMTKNDVKLWVEDNMLVVKAEKVIQKERKIENGKAEVEEEDAGEWSAQSYGKYSSRIALPENVMFDKIKAEVKDGVLYIAIPKASVSSKIFDINVQ